MCGDGLRSFDAAALQQINRNARGPEGVTIRLVAHVGGRGAALDHAKHIDAAHAAVAEATLFCHRPAKWPLGRGAERS